MAKPARRKVIAPSNTPELCVKPLPLDGRPSRFSAYVGKFSISARATPTEAQVGDPITLTVQVSGTPCVEHIQLPALDSLAAFTNDFKILPQRDSGRHQPGSGKVFTRTIRPLRADVKEIPGVELAYFDEQLRKYMIARTDPIPLTVKQVKVVSGVDADGSAVRHVMHSVYGLTDAAEAHRLSSRLAAWASSPPFILLVLLVLGGFAGWQAARWAGRRREVEAQRAQADSAFQQLCSALERMPQTEDPAVGSAFALDCMRTYLAAKLGLRSRALTFGDVKELLRARGVGAAIIQLLQDFFSSCEACRFAGEQNSGAASLLPERCLQTAGELEQKLGCSGSPQRKQRSNCVCRPIPRPGIGAASRSLL
jgi:hypothetical protein